MIVGANEIDPVYHKASTMVHRHKSHNYPGRGFVGAVQDVVGACSPAEYGTSLESGSGVCLIDMIVDAELPEGGTTCPEALRGLPSSLN